MSIRIVTDSTSDLPALLAEKYGITVVPCFINLENQSYLDQIQLSRQQFYEKIPSLKYPPTTSSPGIGSFVEVYQRLALAGASEIISIHISGTLSNIPNIARIAAEGLTGIPVTVIDSGQMSLGTGFLALAAAQAAVVGEPTKDIIKMLDEQKARTCAFAALDTLEYLRRSGRISVLQASLGSLIQIKPVLKIYQGNVTMERVRTHSAAVRRLVEMVKNLQPLERIALLHTHALQEATSLLGLVEPYLPNREAVLIAEATTVLGVHLGPGAVGCVCISAPAVNH